ncbi:tryptophan-rich sensory protein [soil metagenome]
MSRPQGWVRWVGLLGWVAISFVPAWIGQQATSPDWYQQLDQPAWAPPTFLFGPVWTLLYALMGFAAWLVWLEGGFARAIVPLGIFLVQLVPNAAWSILFFGMRRMDLALLDIVLLWLLIVATILTFFRIRRLAGLLLLPYLAWVTFATALNFALWQMNP